MAYYIQFSIYITCLLGALLAGLFRWKFIDAPSRIIVYGLALGLITELIGLYASIKYRNNMGVYNVASLFLVLLVFRYYQYHFDYMQRRGVGLLAYAFSISIWAISTIYTGSLLSENLIFTDYEIMTVVVLSVILLDRMAHNGYSTSLRQNPHFYFVVLFILFRGISFVQWNLYEYLTLQHPATKPLIDFGLWTITLVLHLGIGLIFVFYPKIRYVKS